MVPVLLAAAVLGLAGYLAVRIASPDTVLLVGENGASWIRRERAFSVAGFGGVYEQALFQKHVTVRSRGAHTVTIHALRTCRVFWDHQEVPCWSSDRSNWKEPWQAELTDLTPGEHTLAILVDNTFGPAVVMAYCDSLGVRTGRDWQEWHDTELRPVATVDDIELPEISQRFTSPVRALCSTLVWAVPLFVAAWAGLTWINRRGMESKFSSWFTASRFRWIVVAAWVVLAANNFLKLPADIGNDLAAHVDYIRFIAERGQLPDARNGLEMYQAPLYYLFSAVAYRAATSFVSANTALLWLRWIPLLCGIGFVEVCFRAGRCVFPQREDLQSLTVLLGGLLPMNLYTSQVLSNEPLSALLGALVVLLCLQALRDPARAHRARFQWALGLILGLALLAKVSALLLIPPVVVVLLLTNAQLRWTAHAAALARCFGIVALVAGWYYARNWMIFGKPLVGNWDVETGIPWWQDPGYRTPLQMASFGAALWHPIHAAFYSVWMVFTGRCGGTAI
jgi:hypothetical protein